MLSIKEQYQHPHWQRKRLEIFRRDKWECQCCKKSNKALHVHHLYYEKNAHIWDIDDEGLVTVCYDCHKLLHEELNKLAGIIAIQILKGNIDSINITEKFKNYIKLTEQFNGQEQKIIHSIY